MVVQRGNFHNLAAMVLFTGVATLVGALGCSFDIFPESEPLKGCRATNGECGHFLDRRTLGDAALGCFVGL